MLALLGSAIAFPGVVSAAPLSPQASGVYKLDRAHSSLVFRINHLGYSYYVGRFNVMDAELVFDARSLGKSSVRATITPGSIDVNDDDFEKKLRGPDYFDVEQFPEILFVSNKITRTGESTGIVEGDLTFLGVTEPVALDVTFNNSGINPYTSKYTIGFSASATIERSDWGMDILVPQISDSVTVQFEGEFQKVEEKDS